MPSAASATPLPLDDFLRLGGGSEPTVIEQLVLRVGDTQYAGGAITVSTQAIQQRLRALLDRQAAAAAGPATGGAGSTPANSAAETANAADGGPHKGAGAHAQRPANGQPIAPREQMSELPPVDESGRVVGARPDFHKDTAVQRPDKPDSGIYYRDRNWNDLLRQAQQARGPPQVPLHERITLTERQHEVRKASREGTRVNPSSQKREYSLDGYETEVYIDPNRSIDVPLPKGKARATLPPKATESAVLFETTAVAAKIRNTHKVGFVFELITK